MGIGLCANSHLEGTLAKLDEFGKSDAFKKSPSIFNLLKVQITSTVFLKLQCCYRHHLVSLDLVMLLVLLKELQLSVFVFPSLPFS